MTSKNRLTTNRGKSSSQGGVYFRGSSMSGMRRVMSPAQPTADALRMDAERAGLAWACPFSSSDEFEAAVISARRRSGAYGRKWLRGPVLCAIVAAGMTAVLCLMI